MILIGNKKQKNTIIVRQLSQRKEGAKKDIFDEFSQAGIKFYENHRDRDVRRHIITLHQIWRDKCMSGSESISEVYLESCSALKVNPSKEINALRQTLESLVNESDYYLKSQCGSPTLGRLEMVEPHISEADAMMRPFLFKRISEIVENSNDGFCHNKLIYRHVNPIGKFWRNNWEKIVLAILVAVGGKLIWPTISPTIKKAISTWLGFE